MDKTKLSRNPRFEKKFVTQNLESSEIYHLIKHNPAMFSKNFYDRQVNNIYFDFINSKNYHDHLAGNAQRIKTRVRWYGKMFGLIKNPILEFKIKNGFLGEKKSFKLKPFILDKNFCFKSLQKETFKKSNIPNYIFEIIKMSKPVLLNSFKRRYFRSADKKIRITVDKDLKFFKIKERNNNFVEKIFDKDLQIIEIKYSKEYDDEVSKIAQNFPFRMVANSKYIRGVDLLDLV